MKKLASLTAVALVTMLIFSCKPEKPDSTPGPISTDPTDTSQTSKNLLGKVVSTTGKDSTIFTYKYDAQNRLVWYSNTSTMADYLEDTSSIVRDDNGIIKKILYNWDSSSKYPDPKLDTLVYNLAYNSTTSHYTSKVLAYKSYNFNFKDSSAYTYDAQNRIVREDVYYFDYVKTRTYQPTTKRELVYNASGYVTNLKTVYYKVDGINDYPYEITYTYEDKGLNLLNLGNEAVLLGLEQDFSAHVPKTMVSTHPLSPQYNHSYTYTYTYNSKYRPLTASVNDAVTGTKSTKVYSYQ
jgi:hypothetical protein